MSSFAFSSVVLLAVVTGCTSVYQHAHREPTARRPEISETVLLSGTYEVWSPERRRYLYLQFNSDGTGMYASSSPRDPLSSHFGVETFYAFTVTWRRTGPSSFEAVPTKPQLLAMLHIRTHRIKNCGGSEQTMAEQIIVDEAYIDGSTESLLTRKDFVDEAVEGVRKALADLLPAEF